MYRYYTFIGILIIVSACFSFMATKAHAATLINSSDTLTTSRPSASAPLNADQAANATQVTVVDNGSMFLASDSATFRPDLTETMDTGANVASESAVSGGTRTVFFTNTVAHVHHKGDPVVVPITAMHTIKFTTVTAIPTLGKITLTFPALTTGDANTTASPSATTFQLNSLSDTQVKINGLSGAGTFTGTYTNPTNGTSPTVALALTGTTNIPAGTTVTILLGCTANSGASCTTQNPLIINPTKTAAAGTADRWNISITTRDVTNGIDLDSTNIKVGTQESVFVQANVDSTFSFTIAGVNNGTALNNSSYCGTAHNADTTNSGFNTSATDVNLGTIGATASNSAAQILTITSNAVGGYVITATSSGHFINPANGQFLPNAQGDPSANDSPAPATMAIGTAGFGIHACDANGKVTTNTWGQGPDKFANPSASFYYTLVSSSTQPAPSGDSIVVLYRGNVSGITPPGIYRTIISFVATPIF